MSFWEIGRIGIVAELRGFDSRPWRCCTVIVGHVDLDGERGEMGIVMIAKDSRRL